MASRLAQNQVMNVDGQISYLFCHMYEVLKRPPESIVQELGRLARAYPNEGETFGFYCHKWSSDAYVVLGKYREALDALPEPKLDGCSSLSTDNALSIRLLLSERIRGRDVVTLGGPQTTRWGREHLNEIVTFIETIVRARKRKIVTQTYCNSGRQQPTNANFSCSPVQSTRGTSMCHFFPLAATRSSSISSAMLRVKQKTPPAKSSDSLG